MASEGEENHCLLRNDPGIHPAASPVWASGLGAWNDENDEVRKDRRGWEAEYREGPEWKLVPVQARRALSLSLRGEILVPDRLFAERRHESEVRLAFGIGDARRKRRGADA